MKKNIAAVATKSLNAKWETLLIVTVTALT
jgi:hypothetical protein